MHAHVRVTLRRFDDRGVKCGASDRVDALLGIDIVGREMQHAGFIVNHPAAHRDGVLQRFISDADAFERMNSPGRNRQIDRTPADYVAFAWISASLVKVNIISSPAQVRCEQPARQSAADQNKFRIQVNKSRIKSAKDAT